MTSPLQEGAADQGSRSFNEVVAAISRVIGVGDEGIRQIRPESFLGADLGMASVAVARLAGVLQKHSRGRPLPFHLLFVSREGDIRQDIRVADVASFLDLHRKGGVA
jgi:hypothetical protein